ncbi:hypothetical protein OZX69_09705 (plasmid) [Lactobacillus sp. ESL0731]|uniref:hypothetical protein n=1 Tax=unclassified Lactobacillus TaxID=2620435 RepID=UPI0023F8B783|nr:MULTISPECIES: hypothetical protein [unclassified Lactobacillus]WEV52082.1 hypothetical protein OZX63_09620 [Lactobacillus sp. ESL0700]WEV63227.1 hypothetical protein OZX69_09705 [Lactobacillus sp. ESL0731]
MRNTDQKQKRSKTLQACSINKVFEVVLKVKMFGRPWINGQDGNFYEIASDGLGSSQPLSFVYQYMQEGYDIHGKRICYRKRTYSKYTRQKSILIWQKQYRKRK